MNKKQEFRQISKDAHRRIKAVADIPMELRNALQTAEVNARMYLRPDTSLAPTACIDMDTQKMIHVTKDIQGVSEVVNDLNGRLINFWRVLRGDTFEQFRRQVDAIPLGRSEWETGSMQGFTPLTRTRVRRGMNGNASEWLSAVDGLPDVHERLCSVVIECRPALDVSGKEDGPKTLFYLDPPYLHATRTTKDGYACEMALDDHQKLLDMLVKCQGKVMLSGYPSDLSEVLWCNY